MSTPWRQRTAQHWKQYLIGQLGEVVNRKNNRSPDAVSLLHQRIATTSSDALVDLIEPFSRFEVPDVAWHMPFLYELRQLSAEIISITNDLVSAEKEEAQGDTANNLLLVLEDQEQCSRPEAVERLRRMVHDRFCRFLRLEPQVADLDEILSTDGTVAVRRHVSGLHDLLAADNEWEHTSGRYASTGPDEQPGEEPSDEARRYEHGFRRFLTRY